MPKRKEAYDSDNGFVEDAPKNKKQKGGNTKAPVSSEMHKDDEGNEYWEVSHRRHYSESMRALLSRFQISRTRRVQISSFKGNTMVGIREFYEKDGKMLPGKKVG